MNQLLVWEFILDRLKKSQRVILICVVDSQGSSPGRRGFKMAVASDDMSGSIGGGVMEHKFVELAIDKLKSTIPDTIVRKQVHSKSARMNQSGMICSGEQTVVLFQLNASHLKTVQEIIFVLSRHKSGMLLISTDTFSFSEDSDEPDYFFESKSENDWVYKERLGYKNHLYIIGGGHCSLAFARLMNQLDFYIHLFDDRDGLNTFSQNVFVHEKKIIPDYNSLKDIIPSGENVYVVIMTFGYRTDDIALRAIIHKNFKYLGVLGSQSKIEKMFEDWRKDSLPEDKLKRIYAPVGLNISSQSPEEIAISIAAEIISVKNKI